MTVLIGVLAFGCGDDDDDGPGGNADAAPGGGADAAPLPEGFTVSWGPVTVQPGVEDTQCVTKRLGNTEPLQAHQIHNLLGDVSHHLIVYRVADTEERPEPYDCQPFADTLNPENGTPLVISQKAEDLLTLPEGVAFELGANQMIRLELHYVNAGTEPKEVQATSTFVPIAEEDFEAAADILFMGEVDIELPPNQTSTIGPSYVALPSALADANFFAITGHEHQWGTGVTVESMMNASTADAMVYDPANFNWDEPVTETHDPPFNVPSGGGFRITCTYDNQSGQTVGFGEGVNDEMCFFWAYYYPSAGARVCFRHTGFNVSGCCPDLGAICDNVL